jgi:hypothetical protein
MFDKAQYIASRATGIEYGGHNDAINVCCRRCSYWQTPVIVIAVLLIGIGVFAFFAVLLRLV